MNIDIPNESNILLFTVIGLNHFLFFFDFFKVFFQIVSVGAVVKCTDERGVHEADAWLCSAVVSPGLHNPY